MATLLTDPNDFSDRYNTKLSKKEEKAFQRWAKSQGREKDVYDYDLRGAWKEIQSGKMKESDNGHLGDKYKKPNHPTFSDESIYSNDEHKGGRWGSDSNGRTTFTASEHNLKNMSKKQLKQYFKEREPDADVYFEDDFDSIARKIYGPN